MTKILHLFLACCFSGLLFGQIKSEDFESFSDGDYVNEADISGHWDTWSGSSADASDARIIDTSIARSGSKVMYIDEGNDMVFDFEDKTTGRFEVSFYLWMEDLKGAYFNLLQNFDGADSDWAMQINFQPHGEGVVDAGKPSIDTVDFAHEIWQEVKIIIDLDDDFATVYFAGKEVANWKWSLGAMGNNNTQKLDGLNFYGLSGNSGSSSFFVDDIAFYERTSPEAPTELTVVEVAGDATLNWQAPASYNASGYSIMANSQEIASAITSTNYTDTKLYPGNYAYQVRAAKDGEGYSKASNIASVGVEGGVGRKAVMYEVVTGTWCVNCPAAARGVEQMRDTNGHEVAIIEYHGGDEYENTFARNRISYYGVTGYPTTMVDGNTIVGGGGYDNSNYASYANAFGVRNEIPSVFWLNLKVSLIADTTYLVEAKVTPTTAYFSGTNLKLHIALLESHIEDRWQGMQYVDFVLREMYPGAGGTQFDGGDTIVFSDTISIDSSKFSYGNCEMAAFIQNESDNEILQSSIFDFNDIYPLSVKNYSFGMSIYPNPAKSFINIEASNIKAVSLYNLNGQLVSQVSLPKVQQHTMRLTDLERGFYILVVNTQQGPIKHKIFIE